MLPLLKQKSAKELSSDSEYDDDVHSIKDKPLDRLALDQYELDYNSDSDDDYVEPEDDMANSEDDGFDPCTSAMFDSDMEDDMDVDCVDSGSDLSDPEEEECPIEVDGFFDNEKGIKLPLSVPIESIVRPKYFYFTFEGAEYRIPHAQSVEFITKVWNLNSMFASEQMVMRDFKRQWEDLKNHWDVYCTSSDLTSFHEFANEKVFKPLLTYADGEVEKIDTMEMPEMGTVTLSAKEIRNRDNQLRDQYAETLIEGRNQRVLDTIANPKPIKQMAKKPIVDNHPEIAQLDFSKDLDELQVGLREHFELIFSKGTELNQIYALRVYMHFYRTVVHGKKLWMKIQADPFPIKGTTFLLFLIWARQNRYAYSTVKNCFCNALCRVIELNGSLGKSPRTDTELVGGILRALRRKYGNQTFKSNALLNPHMFAWIKKLNMGLFRDIMLKALILFGRYTALRGDSIKVMNLFDIEFQVQTNGDEEWYVNAMVTIRKEKYLGTGEIRNFYLHGKKNHEFCPVMSLIFYLFHRGVFAEQKKGQSWTDFRKGMNFAINPQRERNPLFTHTTMKSRCTSKAMSNYLKNSSRKLLDITYSMRSLRSGAIISLYTTYVIMTDNPSMQVAASLPIKMMVGHLKTKSQEYYLRQAVTLVFDYTAAQDGDTIQTKDRQEIDAQYCNTLKYYTGKLCKQSDCKKLVTKYHLQSNADIFKEFNPRAKAFTNSGLKSQVVRIPDAIKRDLDTRLKLGIITSIGKKVLIKCNAWKTFYSLMGKVAEEMRCFLFKDLVIKANPQLKKMEKTKMNKEMAIRKPQAVKNWIIHSYKNDSEWFWTIADEAALRFTIPAHVFKPKNCKRKISEVELSVDESSDDNSDDVIVEQPGQLNDSDVSEYGAVIVIDTDDEC